MTKSNTKETNELKKMLEKQIGTKKAEVKQIAIPTKIEAKIEEESDEIEVSDTSGYYKAFKTEMEKQVKKYIQSLYDDAYYIKDIGEYIENCQKAVIALSFCSSLLESIDTVWGGDILNISEEFEDLIVSEYDKGLPLYDSAYVLEEFEEWSELITLSRDEI